MSEEQIMELVRQEKNRYAKEWRRKNPDKVAANNRRYWQRKAFERLEKEKAEGN